MFTIDLGIVIFAFIANVFLGFFPLYKNFKSATNRIFFFFTLSLAFYNFFNYLALHQVNDLMTLFWIRTVIATALLINILFFLLVFAFPQNKLIIDRALFIYALVFTCLLVPLTFTNFIFARVIPSTTQPIPGNGISLFVFHTLVFLGGGFIILISKLRKSVGIAKAQLKLFLLGTVFMFALIIVTNLFFVIILHTTALVGLLPLYTIVFVGFVTYAIVKHRFLDIRLIVVRSIAYSLLLLLWGGFYTVDIFMISRYFFKDQLGTIQAITYGLLTLFIALTFQPFRRLLEETTADILFKNNYNSNDLVSRLTKIMASTLLLDDLMKGTLEELIQTIHITRGAFVILRGKDGLYPVISEGFEKDPVYDVDFIQDFSSRKRIFVFDEEDDEKLKQIMREENLTVILPLFEDDHVQGVLLLGEKKSGEIYSQQDIQVLEIFGPEVSVAIQNAKAYEEISRFNLTLKDEVDKATRDLQGANERLKELDKLKDEFVSIASHELRTPMTAIKSYLWMALAGQGGDLTDKQRFYIQRGYNSVERLIKLVNDMLNVSRIESGRISLEMQRTDMTTLVHEVMDEVTPRADELGLHIRFDSSSIPSSVLADPDKIKEVLFNLIGNSLKFTPKDGTITISFEEKDGMVETKVSDTGAGIDQANIQNLFHKFGILPGSYAANQSAMGTGLGLYICKSIVELQDGKIWAESAGKGKGTTFIFTLPVFSDDRLAKFHEKHKDDHQEHVGLEHTEL